MEHSELQMEQHAKKKERLQIFYQRQLDKKQRLANSLREELNDAKVKLQAVEQGIKKKERNMNVVMYDMDRKQKSSVHSLEKQVGKVVRLLASRRGIQAKSANTHAVLSQACSKRVRTFQAGIQV